MMNTMSLSERLRLVANVSDLMLAGSIRVYRPDDRPQGQRGTIIYDKTHRAAA